MEFNQLITELYQRLNFSNPEFLEREGFDNPLVILQFPDLGADFYLFELDGLFAMQTQIMPVPERDPDKSEVISAALHLTCAGAYYDNSILYYDQKKSMLLLHKQFDLKMATVSKLEVELEKFCSQMDFYSIELRQLAN